MALVAVTNVDVLNNPAAFTQDFSFEITFECIAELQDDIEWKIIYVGSAESEDHDQVLDSILVGPVPVGLNKFVFEASAPNCTTLPPSEIVGVTVVLITCSYKQQEFVRIGYYVNNDFSDPEMKENPPMGMSSETMVQHLGRIILHDKPRVTRYTIDWDGSKGAAAAGGLVGAVEWEADGGMVEPEGGLIDEELIEEDAMASDHYDMADDMGEEGIAADEMEMDSGLVM
eukprot:m.160475 g.160475  ORF g.160475 m.160475 type:complete len:229 (-) comp23790_c0_seq1:1373-2059(-)